MLNLIDLTIKQLKYLAKSYELTGYSKLRKNDLIELINNHTNQLGLGKKHKRKFLKREERRKNKKEYKRIEAEKRQKIKEQKKVNLAEEKLVKKREKRKRQKEKQKEKQQKETTQVKEFKEKAEQKKSSFKKLKEKELVETKSALKKFTKQFTVDGEVGFDPKSFFNATKVSILRILRENRQQKVKLILKCLMKRIDLKTGEETKKEAAFHSEILNSMIEEVLENMANFQRRGSNWRFEEILKLELHLVEFSSLKGNSYIPLPEKIVKKKAIVNMKNEDNECFKWCVTRALNPVDKNKERITQKLRKQSEELNWKGIDFPVQVDKINKFEKIIQKYPSMFFILMEVFNHWE